MKTPSKKDMGVAILILKSALIKIYSMEDHLSDEGYKTIENALTLTKETLK